MVFSSHRASTCSGPHQEPVAFDRDLAHLDVEVAAELVPADLHRTANEVRLVSGFALGLHLCPPAPFRREATEHRRFAGAGGRAADGVQAVGRIPKIGENMNAASLDLRGLRILVLVAHIFVDALGHQRLHLGFHPGGAKGRKVLPRIAIKQQLIVDKRVSGSRRALLARNLMFWNRQRRIVGSMDNVEHLPIGVMLFVK